MRYNIIKKDFAMSAIRICSIIIPVLLMPTASFAWQPHCYTCSQQTIAGAYAFETEGTVIMTLEDGTQAPVPSASLSIITIDHEGSLSAHGYTVVGNQITQYGIGSDDPAMFGTITVNPDCTGIVKFDDGTISEVAIYERGNQLKSIMVSSPSGFPAVTGWGKRISLRPDISCTRICCPNRVVGTYIISQRGINMTEEYGPVPNAFMGSVSVHYNSTVEMKGSIMIAVAGAKIPFTFENGEWQEGELAYNGWMTGTVMAGGSQVLGQPENWFVVLDGGNELWGIALDDGGGNPVALTTMERVSLWPADLK
jgi:hypothetical protein